MSIRRHPPQQSAAWKRDVRVIDEGLFDGQRAIVTGAGSGIGRAIATRLVELGAVVVGLGRRDDALAATERSLDHLRGRFTWIAVDLRDCEAARAAIVRASQDGLDLLVNNAGGQFYARTTDITDNGFRSVVDLNLNAVFTAISAAQPALAIRGGSIVNISLSGVDRGGVGLAHSLSARAGVLALSRTLALEWAHLGIRINCLGPGAVLTQELSPAVLADLEGRIVPESVPAGRATPPEDIAELVAFLASAAGRMISGQMLQVDGAAHLGRGLHMVENWPPTTEEG